MDSRTPQPSLEHKLTAIRYAYEPDGAVVWVVENMRTGSIIHLYGPILSKQSHGTDHIGGDRMTIHGRHTRVLWVCDPREFATSDEFVRFVRYEI
jgi:hypothetical protein